jgi:hypothetical protein
MKSTSGAMAMSGVSVARQCPMTEERVRVEAVVPESCLRMVGPKCQTPSTSTSLRREALRFGLPLKSGFHSIAPRDAGDRVAVALSRPLEAVKDRLGLGLSALTRHSRFNAH